MKKHGKYYHTVELITYALEIESSRALGLYAFTVTDFRVDLPVACVSGYYFNR